MDCTSICVKEGVLINVLYVGGRFDDGHFRAFLVV